MSRAKYYIFLVTELALFTGGVLLIHRENRVIAFGILLIFISFHVGSYARDKIRDRVNDMKIRQAKREAKQEFFEGRTKRPFDA
jgi:hypothetical protein